MKTYPLTESEAYNLTSNHSTHEPKKPLAVLYSFMYSKPQGLKSLLTNGTDHPDSVDFLRLMTFSLGRTLAYLKEFSMGDGARNKRPQGNNSARLFASFEPLPAPLQNKFINRGIYPQTILAPNIKMLYSILTPKTNGVGFDSLKLSTGAKHRLHSLAVFFCALLARLYSLWVGASVDAFERAGYLLSQSVNPLVTRPPYLTVGKVGLFKTNQQELLNHE